ncbi:MAG: gliding motility protein GldL [Prevotella sp.]|nr:gliding motility protein GldL [Prevotella sp.]
MTKYSKINVVYRLQKWMDSVAGQTFLNYAYSWGAAIVVLGALFKLIHLPGADVMLILGMGTEVVVFFLSAFDRPFDKTTDGMELSTHIGETKPNGVASAAQSVAATASVAPSAVAKKQIIGVQTPLSAAIVPAATAAEGMAEAQQQYVEALQQLTLLYKKVGEQSQRLTQDSEEMTNLNRTLTGITKVYEMQLKSASQQMGTIDDIQMQTKLLAQHIEQLNGIYARMIEAMTTNMRAAASQPTQTP